MTHLHWDSCPPLGVAAGPPRRCRPVLLPAAKTDAKIQGLSSEPKWWKRSLIPADDDFILKWTWRTQAPPSTLFCSLTLTDGGFPTLNSIIQSLKQMLTRCRSQVIKRQRRIRQQQLTLRAQGTREFSLVMRDRTLTDRGFSSTGSEI